jgi:hypothetical protein
VNKNRVLENLQHLVRAALLTMTTLGCSLLGSSLSEAVSAATRPLAACSLLTEAEWETLVGPSLNAPDLFVTPVSDRQQRLKVIAGRINQLQRIS